MNVYVVMEGEDYAHYNDMKCFLAKEKAEKHEAERRKFYKDNDLHDLYYVELVELEVQE